MFPLHRFSNSVPRGCAAQHLRNQILLEKQTNAPIVQSIHRQQRGTINQQQATSNKQLVTVGILVSYYAAESEWIDQLQVKQANCLILLYNYKYIA